MLEYHAAYYRDQDSGWYTVQVLDFPAAVSQGRTLQSARRMIRAALRGVAEWYLEDGEPLPRPNPRAADKKADLGEPIRVQIRILAGSRS